MRYQLFIVALICSIWLIACGGTTDVVEPAVDQPAAIVDQADESETAVVSEDASSVESDPVEEAIEVVKEVVEEVAVEETAVEMVEQSSEPIAETADPVVEVPAIPQEINLDDFVTGDQFSDNFVKHIIITWDGVDQFNAPISVEMEMLAQIQTLPVSAQATHITMRSTDEPDFIMKSVELDGQYFFSNPDTGCMVTDVSQIDNSFSDGFVPVADFTAPAQLLEKGVGINGIITDQYAISYENLITDESMNPENFDFTVGHAFVARDGNYIARLFVEGKAMPDGTFADLNPNEEATITMQFDFIPVANALDISIPADCAAQQEANADFLVMPEATNLTSMPEGILFQSAATYEETLDFYREQMVADGWVINFDENLGSFAEIEFAKDGRLVSVGVVQNGEVVAVSVLNATQ